MIVLNGGSYWPDSFEVDNLWLSSISPKDKIAFIPAATTRTQSSYFEFFRDNISNYGLSNVMPVDIYANWTSDVRDSRVIYIAGGNTFKLMKILRESGFADYLLRNKEQLCIIGNSAGAVVLGENILTTNDENDYEVTNYSGLGLIPYSICPHYSKEKDERLSTLSERYKLSILGMSEKSGIAISPLSEERVGIITEITARGQS